LSSFVKLTKDFEIYIVNSPPERAAPYADALPDLAGPGRRPLHLVNVSLTNK